MKLRISGEFAGTFKEGKGYKDIDYHIKEIAKFITINRFSFTCENAPEKSDTKEAGK
jgi:hypothetical protein